MTVRKLIADLKKMPANAKIAVVDHDQDDQSGECNGGVIRIGDAPKALKERGYGVVIYL